MARVYFYEKPGCGGNGRQKAALRLAGHEVIARDLLREPWTAARLKRHFGARPVAEWFNPASPRIRRGEIDPATVGAERALELMLADPLLIRRPLLEAGGRCEAGFEPALIHTWLGLTPGTAVAEGCVHEGRARCDAPAPHAHPIPTVPGEHR